MRLPTRTNFLLVFAFLFLVVTTRAQSAPPPATPLPFTLKPLGPNIYAAIDDAKGDAGANAGFVIGENGVLVIDTFENEAAARALLAEIRKLTALPIKFVVNTHYHLDHVAGNKIFQQAGAVIIGHQNIPGWIHTENLKFFGKDIKPDQAAMVANLVSPDVVYSEDIKIFLGSVAVDVRFFLGHTGGDSVVSIPRANVIFCGDLFWKNTFPNLIDASTGSWIATLDKLASARHKASAFVPGHGDVGNAEDVATFNGYLKFLRSTVASAEQGRGAEDELVKTVLPAVQDKYGTWDLYAYFARSNILDTAAELRGRKKIPAPPAPDPQEKTK